MSVYKRSVRRQNNACCARRRTSRLEIPDSAYFGWWVHMSACRKYMFVPTAMYSSVAPIKFEEELGARQKQDKTKAPLRFVMS